MPSTTTRPSNPRPRPAAGRRRRWLLLGALALAAVAAVAVVLAVSGGDDGGKGGEEEARATVPKAEDGPAPTTAPTESNDAKPVNGGVCSAEQVAASQVTSGLRGTNQIGVFVLTNRSGTACKVNGVPTVELLDDKDAKLTATVSPGGGAIPAALTAKDVDLAPGGQASFAASWSPAGNGCKDVSALRIALPNSRGTVKVATSVRACGEGLPVSVSPIQPGVVSV